MATWAVGDIQGCHEEFRELLSAIKFNESGDRLWLVGDLVNRGPDSLSVVRHVRDLGDAAVTVLGNHDLHLLAVARADAPLKRGDTLQEFLDAPDAGELLDWLATRPFLHRDTQLGYSMIHAGLPPQWSVDDAEGLARELQHAVDPAKGDGFLEAMYGNKPDRWSEELHGQERWRFACNCFTRMRYCDAAGRLGLEYKGPPGSQPAPLLPWYAVPSRQSRHERIIFGHWSNVHLGAARDFDKWNVFPLDTGCVWGGELTAIRLEDLKRVSVPSHQPKKH